MDQGIKDHVLNINLQGEDRISIRREVISHWIDEEPGFAELRHRYYYYVETACDGSRVSLHRPAWKNKGIDFVVWCENFETQGKRSRPSHEDVYRHLNSISADFPSERHQLALAVKLIWECRSPETAISVTKFPADGLPRVDRLLRVLRWLFIEQDLTYWTETGRQMLRGGIEKKFARLP